MSKRNGRTRNQANRSLLVVIVGLSFNCFLLGFIHAFRLLNPSHNPFRARTLIFNAQEVDAYDGDNSWKDDSTVRPTPRSSSEADSPNAKSSITSSSIKEKIQQLKDSVDILTVVESYSLPQFRRTGPDRATAICPFHEDRHPSLSMDASKQIYKCFSCGKGGDVIHFVQEYSKLPIWQPQPELSFLQAARYIGTKFGNGDVLWTGNWTQSSVANTHKKERILLANAYAASFYSNCFQQPFAGGARYHVRTRGLSVPTIRTFAIGYAPDAYWDGRGASKKGQGSLVEHLLSVGVSAREMLDSGLAVLENGAMLRGLSNRTQDVLQSAGEEVDPSLLVDRFRNRIMVPIWDESGSQILGFGGRIVPPPETDGDTPDYPQQRGFKTAKYLNSPESDVFVKRKILFGQHLAKSALQKFTGRTERTPPLLIVEGYMDAMTLWNAGIRNVVASMGTAISLEQLELAARTSGTRDGRIILCLDNDEAGRMAVERLCGNGIIAECIAKYTVAVLVGQLPSNIQDPADFIEYQRKQGIDARQTVENFQFEVVDKAIDWTEWYVQQLIRDYDRDAPSGSAGSFSVVFERIADFLASFLGPAERTKRAYEVAGQLSNILANEQNATDISVSVRIQLESDLINLASRLTLSKQSIQRRVAEASNDASLEDPKAVASLVRGHGPSSDDHLTKLSKNATMSIASIERVQTSTRKGTKRNPIRDVHSPSKSSTSRRPIKTTRAKLKREPDGVSLTAHFNGFRFAHESDMDWLGLRDNNKKKGRTESLVLGQRQPSSLDVVDGDTQSRSNKLIYFNSVGFNGNQFLTDSAIDAGYSRQSVKPDASVIETGLASLVEQDVSTMIVAAEDALLRILVHDGSARSIVKNMLSARLAVSYGGDIHWSCPEKQWLFDVLLGQMETTAEKHIEPLQLRAILAQLPDAPPGAFSNETFDIVTHQATLLPEETLISEYNSSENAVDSESMAQVAIAGTATVPSLDSNVLNASLAVSASSTPLTSAASGSLDIFFAKELIPIGPASNDKDTIVGTRNALAVQETLVTLLWASTALKSKLLREKLATNPVTSVEVSQGPSTLSTERSIPTSDSVVTSSNTTLSAVSKDEPREEVCQPLDVSQVELLQQLRETTLSLQTLQASTHRIRSRLLDESTSTGIEGSISRALQLDLASQLDDHVRSGWQQFPPPGINDVPYETELERMATEWGEWYEDDFFWTPGTSAAVTPVPRMAEDVSGEVSASDRESVDDFMERVHREWKDWVD